MGLLNLYLTLRGFSFTLNFNPIYSTQDVLIPITSHHRVHHARNPYCIDKNYAGVFIIWDRLFGIIYLILKLNFDLIFSKWIFLLQGTFEAEKKTEEIAYGLVHPVQTFDPIYIQMFNYKYIFLRFLQCKSWSERFSVLFKGPGF